VLWCEIAAERVLHGMLYWWLGIYRGAVTGDRCLAS
jgi:hypothetical protein